MTALTVFLVEDNPMIRAHLMPALEELVQAQILATADAQDEAIDWLAHHKGGWDLAVVDLFLRQGNGLEVVRWTCGRQSKQKVAVLTNYANALARKQCLEAGADAVFDKSTELDQFFAFCQNVQHDGGGRSASSP